MKHAPLDLGNLPATREQIDADQHQSHHQPWNRFAPRRSRRGKQGRRRVELEKSGGDNRCRYARHGIAIDQREGQDGEDQEVAVAALDAGHHRWRDQEQSGQQALQQTEPAEHEKGAGKIDQGNDEAEEIESIHVQPQKRDAEPPLGIAECLHAVGNRLGAPGRWGVVEAVHAHGDVAQILKMLGQSGHADVIPRQSNIAAQRQCHHGEGTKIGDQHQPCQPPAVQGAPVLRDGLGDNLLGNETGHGRSLLTADHLRQ